MSDDKWTVRTVVDFYGSKENPIKRFRTDCCALGQLSVNNDHSVQEIKAVVDEIKKETDTKWTIDNRGGGERALFVITTPYETKLAERLAEVGFKKITEFNRRNGYPQVGLLSMWIINW